MPEITTPMVFEMLLGSGREKVKELNELSKDPMRHNENLLMEILEKNQDTEYGRKYNFSRIKSAADYAAALPFTNYDSYSPYIDEMKTGSDSFMTKEQPVAFAATSGSVGNPKAIPVSTETLGAYRDYGTAFGLAIIDRDIGRAWKRGKVLNLSEIKLKEMPSGKKYGSISGLLIESLKQVMPLISTSPEECVFPQEIMENVYIHARFALEYNDLSGIFSSFMTITLDFLNYIRNHWEILTDDIESGTINEEINIPDYVRESLMKKITPNPERARELKKEFAAGFDSTILKRIWPDIAFIHTIGSGGFSSYTRKFKEYAGDLPICNASYAASEALMAVCTQMDTANYALLPNAVFFEFIPIEHSHEENPATLTLDKLKVGENYEIVITNTAGFYRYRIQDVIKVVGMYNNCPEIQFSYRLNQMISLAGEKTNDEHFRWAISELEKQTGCGIGDYAVYPDTSDSVSKYVVLLEPSLEVATGTLMRNGAVAAILQEKLSAANPSYGAKVQAGMLSGLEVRYAQQQTFALYRDLMAMRGISPNQIKPVRILDTPEKERFFFKLTEKL